MRRNTTGRTRILFLAAAFAFLFLFAGEASAGPVDSLIDGHNTCVQCHGRFPGTNGAEGKNSKDRPAVIPKNKIDLLCMSCHGPAGIANTKANVHGRLNYVVEPIGCVICHDPHDNNPNYLQGSNIKSIGRILQKPVSGEFESQNSPFAKIDTPNSRVRYVVFESRGSDVGDSPVHSFADGDRDKNGVYDGICEVCHTRTKYHRNTASGNHSHYAGQTCTNCHLHVNQFLAFAAGGDEGATDVSGTVVDDSGFAWAGITLFLDINGNGVYDEGEPIAVTDENGNFVFKGFPSKGYDVLVMPDSLPDGYDVTISINGTKVSVTTTALPASVQGYAWSDENLSGALENTDLGIPGVTVFADLNSNGLLDKEEPVAVTDEYGFYSITGLPHGPCYIQIAETTVPEEFQHITNNNPLYIILGPGEDLTDVNFGYRSRFEFNPDNTRLLYPTRLSWNNSGGYYVTDSKVDAMFIHDSEGNLTGKLRGLDKPLAVTTDEEGNIYVGNNGRNNVEVYSSGGILLRTIDSGNLKMPNDLVLDRNQNLYVLDSQNKMVKVYNSDGVFIRRIGRAGAGGGQFAFPIAMAINYRMVDEVEVGELYVADKKSSRIQVFDLDGNFLRFFGGPVEEESGGGMMGMFGGMFGGGGSTWAWEGRFVGVQSLAFDQYGRLHALDSFMDNVQVLDPVTGAYLDSYDAFLEDTGAHLQLDIDISPDGRVIMTNVATRSVEFIYTVQ